MLLPCYFDVGLQNSKVFVQTRIMQQGTYRERETHGHRHFRDEGGAMFPVRNENA